MSSKCRYNYLVFIQYNRKGRLAALQKIRLVLLKTLIVNSTLYVESTCVNSFKGSLGYFKAERVKYCPNLPELLTGNIC